MTDVMDKEIETLLFAALHTTKAYSKANVYTYMYKEDTSLFNEALYVYLVNVVHRILFFKSFFKNNSKSHRHKNKARLWFNSPLPHQWPNRILSIKIVLIVVLAKDDLHLLLYIDDTNSNVLSFSSSFLDFYCIIYINSLSSINFFFVFVFFHAESTISFIYVFIEIKEID